MTTTAAPRAPSCSAGTVGGLSGSAATSPSGAGPGETDGTSDTTGYGDGAQDLLVRVLHSTEFNAERSYSKFGPLTLLEHGGDFEAAARALRCDGYGFERPPADARLASLQPFVFGQSAEGDDGLQSAGVEHGLQLVGDAAPRVPAPPADLQAQLWVRPELAQASGTSPAHA